MTLKRPPFWRRGSKEMKTRTPMAQISAKRLAKLAAQGITNPSTTLVSRKKAMASRPTSTGPDQNTVNAVLERDGFQCVRCGGALWGDRGVHWSVQHRRARGRGGTARPDANSPQNLIALCGSAAGCNGHVESEREEARQHGWAIRQSDDPLMIPVDHSLHGVVHLTADAGWSSRRPEAA